MNKQVIRRPKRSVCIGDMKSRITIHAREAQAPSFQGADLTEKFSLSFDIWASIKSVTGKTFFAGVNADVAVTHEIYARYNSEITPDNWIEFESKYFDILAIEDYEERHKFTRMICTERGNKASESTHA